MSAISRLPLLLVLGSLQLLLLHRGNLCSAASTVGKDWFRSIQAPAELIKDYETHIPIVTRPPTLQDYPQNLVVQVSRFKLYLELNSGLVHPRFSSRYFDGEGHEVIEKAHVNCFYHGTVEGHADWQVVVSTCRGLKGSFGRRGSEQEFYHIEPLDHTNPELEQPHALYLDSQYSHWNGTCGTSGKSPGPSVEVSQHGGGVWLEKHKLRRRQVNGFYIVEWAMINDDAQFTDFGRNLSAVVLRDLEIANFVDSTYRPLNIRVVVVDVITWTRGNPIVYPADNDSNAILDSLTAYVPQIMSERDSLMLITGVNLRGNVVGLAFVGTMCSSRNSVGLTQDRQAPASRVAITASHELGHIFNMDHDDGRQCTCSDPVGICIMAGVSSSNSPPTLWSSCSRSDLSTGFTSSRNLDRCLNNEPLLTVGDPSCGNGIRESNEVCDCGSVEECTDPCCNATSCTLIQGAQCSEGPCCSTDCRFFSLGTVCRAAAQECDIMEYCSGNSSDCPRDVYKQDGSACNQSLEFCFTGACQSLDSQCQRYFLAENGVPECYSELNTQGSQLGNCGARDGRYVACTQEHTQCGQLMCNGGTYQFSELPGINPRISTQVVSSNGADRTCSSFTLFPTADTISPGLVPDGTRCGNESVCVSQSCVELSSLAYIQACPFGSNGQTCSGNGICNNLNQCSCNIGFASLNCDSTTTTGGSSNAGVIVGAVLGTIFGVILAAIVAAAVIVIVVIIRRRSKKKSVPLTARSKPTVGKPSRSITGSQENLLEDSSRDTASVHVMRPSRGYKPPPLHGSPSAPERAPVGQWNASKPPAPTAPTSRVAPVVTRYPPNGSNSSQPRRNGKESPSLHSPTKPKAPPPSRAMPPPPSKSVPPPTFKGGLSSAPSRPGVPPPSSRGGQPPPPSRAAPPLAPSRTVAPSPSYLKGRPPSPDRAKAPSAKPPPYASKPSKVQKQWPPPSSGGNDSSSSPSKPILPAKRPMAPPRR